MQILLVNHFNLIYEKYEIFENVTIQYNKLESKFDRHLQIFLRRSLMEKNLLSRFNIFNEFLAMSKPNFYRNLQLLSISSNFHWN